MGPASISNALIVALIIVPFSTAERWEARQNWCDNPARILYVGDFNADGRSDILCHDPRDGYKWILHTNANGQFPPNPENWYKNLRWCLGNDQNVYIGDFNGDRRDDMLCHDTGDGHVKIAHANSAGNFEGGTTWAAELTWCCTSGAELHIGDFNGDGRYDMLCHDTNTGYKWISHANSQGNFASGTTWQAELGWCNHNGAGLYIGDFNGDRRHDMLCHNANNGNIWITYANRDGNFQDGTDWSKGVGWCYHSGEELHIGDSNGDGRDDLFCHNSISGYKWVALADGGNTFKYGSSWGGDFGWCNQAENKFHVGDYNGDSLADMMCHDAANSYKRVIYASQPYE